MDIPQLGASNNLFKQALNGSATAQEELFQKLRERFLHLAQDILCDREVAVEVANKAIGRVRSKYKKFFKHKKLIQATQKALDDEIESFFQVLIQEVKSGSKGGEQKLFDVLKKRFLLLAQRRFAADKQIIDSADVEDIVQNALLTVVAKYRTTQPQGTFIQWAQAILRNKYREYRRTHIKWGWLTGSSITEKDESTYTKTISDVIIKGRKAKEANEEEIEPSQSKAVDQPENEPSEDDLNGSDPTRNIEEKDLKENLLKIIQNMGEPCKRVLKVLFLWGERNRKFINEKLRDEFPDETSDNIYVIVSRCRKRLKEEALKGGIL